MAVCGNCRNYNDNERWGGKGYCTHWGKYVWGDQLERGCRYYESGGSSSSGGCYLTSACVRAKGLPDDCEELTVLRRFRDEYLRNQNGGAEDIEHYYAVAPQIVDAINARTDSKTIWMRVYDELVKPCVEMIHKNRLQEAYNHYKAYSLSLEQGYCKA